MEKERRKKVKRIIRVLGHYIGFVVVMPMWTFFEWVENDEYDLKESYNAAKALYGTAPCKKGKSI